MKWFLGFEPTTVCGKKIKTLQASSDYHSYMVWAMSDLCFFNYISFIPIMYNVKVLVCLKVEAIFNIWLTKHVVGHVGILHLVAEKIIEISTSHKLDCGSHIAFQIRLKEYFVQDLWKNSNVHLAQSIQKNKNEKNEIWKLYRG